MVTDRFLDYLRYERNRSPLTVEAYGRDVSQFAAWITGGQTERFEPRDVSTNDIRAWLASLSREKISPRSLRRKAQSLRAFFRFLLRGNMIETNPAASLTLPKMSKPLPDVVKAEEVEGILRLDENELTRNPDDAEIRRDSLIVDILYSLGLRRAEIASLSDSDISTYASELKVTGKRSKQRVVPVPPPLMEKITVWQHMRDSLWPDLPAPKPLLVKKGKRMTARQIYLTVHRELEISSARKKSPHALRHTFATSMLNEGADLNSVKEFLGHTSLSTTQIYTHVSFADMKKAYSQAHPRVKKAPDSKKKQDL